MVWFRPLTNKGLKRRRNPQEVGLLWEMLRILSQKTVFHPPDLTRRVWPLVRLGPNLLLKTCADISECRGSSSCSSRALRTRSSSLPSVPLGIFCPRSVSWCEQCPWRVKIRWRCWLLKACCMTYCMLASSIASSLPPNVMPRLVPGVNNNIAFIAFSICICM